MTAKNKASNKKYDKSSTPPQCGLPNIPLRKLDSVIDADRAFLIRRNELKWVNNTVLHFCFLDSPASWKGADNQKESVRKAFKKWRKLGIGLEFAEVENSADAEIRIGFEKGSSWSVIGRNAIDLNWSHIKRTMNFGWDLTTPYGGDTALHEIGHAIGFPHEHQNPNAGIMWDEEAVYAYFKGYPNEWNEEQTYNNVLRKISPAEVEGSNWDKDSIMHYSFNAGLIISPEEYQTKALVPAPGLSATDITEVKMFYPDTSAVKLPELKPFLSKIVKLSAGQQVDYIIQPTISRTYTMQTFGSMDTVMVLFEDDNGEPIYLAGDDDSGTNTNSKIETRLINGRTYYLRLRLYYTSNEGQGGVMLW